MRFFAEFRGSVRKDGNGDRPCPPTPGNQSRRFPQSAKPTGTPSATGDAGRSPSPPPIPDIRERALHGVKGPILGVSIPRRPRASLGGCNSQADLHMVSSSLSPGLPSRNPRLCFLDYEVRDSFYFSGRIQAALKAPRIPKSVGIWIRTKKSPRPSGGFEFNKY